MNKFVQIWEINLFHRSDIHWTDDKSDTTWVEVILLELWFSKFSYDTLYCGIRICNLNGIDNLVLQLLCLLCAYEVGELLNLWIIKSRIWNLASKNCIVYPPLAFLCKITFLNWTVCSNIFKYTIWIYFFLLI